MKKIWKGTVAAALVLSVAATTAFAAGGWRSHSSSYRWSGCQGAYCGTNYVDANGDGICDNRGTGCGRNYLDANGDGVCDNRGTGWGRNYLDADGDGVCDYLGRGHCGRW